MHRTTAALLVAASALLMGVPATASAQDAGELTVTLARAKFGTHARTGSARHTLRIKGTFPDRDALGTFDPALDDVTVRVGTLTVLSVPAGTDDAGYRIHTRHDEIRKWRYRLRGEAGLEGSRKLSVNARTGRFNLVIKRANLSPLRDAGADDVTVSIRVGDVTAETTLSFLITRAGTPVKWHYTDAPPNPGPAGPRQFTSLVAFSLPNTALPHVEIARTQQEYDTLWAARGIPGSPPAVDFTQDMVVTVSSLVRGPGAFPPILDIVAVRNAGAAMEIDWRFALCEENVCPGAPIPCPTATPFHVFKTGRFDGDVRTTQTATVGVCP